MTSAMWWPTPSCWANRSAATRRWAVPVPPSNSASVVPLHTFHGLIANVMESIPDCPGAANLRALARAESERLVPLAMIDAARKEARTVV